MNPNRPSRQLTYAEIEQVKLLYKLGYSISNIARAFYMTPAAITYHVRNIDQSELIPLKDIIPHAAQILETLRCPA